MAEKTMADYLSAVTADYTTTELTIKPHNILQEDGEKQQFVHEFSDGQRGVVTMCDDSIFKVTLEFHNLEPTDEGTIKDLYHDSSKANAMARSFYWVHPDPDDGNTYTVRFMGKLTSVKKADIPFHVSVKQIQLEVLGVKPT